MTEFRRGDWNTVVYVRIRTRGTKSSFGCGYSKEKCINKAFVRHWHCILVLYLKMTTFHIPEKVNRGEEDIKHFWRAGPYVLAVNPTPSTHPI